MSAKFVYCMKSLRALDKREYLRIIFLIETICCDPSSELSRRDDFDEGSQHMFYAELKKIIPNYHQILPVI